MQRLRRGSLAATAVLKWVAGIRLQASGICTTTRTSDLYRPSPAIAPTTPSRPTVAVSIALPSRSTARRESIRFGGSKRDQTHRPVRPRPLLAAKERWSGWERANRIDRAAQPQAICCPRDDPDFLCALRYPARSVGPFLAGG